jgi:hypothetical protein
VAKLDLGTLAGIIRAERAIRDVLGGGAYSSRASMEQTIKGLSSEELGELCVAVNALKEQCRALSLCEIEVE